MPPHRKPPFRADHVGSLLRPKSLLGARSGALGNKISLDDELRKLRLVVETAREVWGA